MSKLIGAGGALQTSGRPQKNALFLEKMPWGQIFILDSAAKPPV